MRQKSVVCKYAYAIQKRIISFNYNKGGRISIAQAIRERTGDCLEAACAASYFLHKKGVPSSLVTLSSDRDEDHVICVFRAGNLYGAIAKSKFLGLRWRYPVYRSPRELAISYFESYFNYSGTPTLKRYSLPVKIDWKKQGILESARQTKKIEDALCDAKLIRLGIPKGLPGVLSERKNAEILIRK